jgi:hypothetical protein
MKDNLIQHKMTYKNSIQEALPRIISMLDREPISQTFGCADRLFWSWKFTDFAGSRFQEVTFLLSELALSPEIISDQKINQEMLVEWTRSSINFWSTLQHKDGSFDEAYPYERSLAATAFTCFYVGEGFLNIFNFYSPEDQLRLQKVFHSAGNWLCKNNEQHGVLSNHLAAAAAALDTIFKITGDKKFSERRDHFINNILEKQSSEGWYEEYSGADIGYQSHTIFYLAYIWTKTKDVLLLDSLRKSIQYFVYFVHLNGSIGGEYSSRNTRFFMPAGFEILANEIPEAASIINFLRVFVHEGNLIGLKAMDPQNIFPLVNNYIFAYKLSRLNKEKINRPLPFEKIGIKKFHKSGHIIVSTTEFQMIIGTSKGGVVALFPKKERGKPSWLDSGIAVEFKSGKKASSQGLLFGAVNKINDTNIEITSNFVGINQILMSPEKFIVFRLITFLSIVSSPFAYFLKNILVKMLIKRKKIYPLKLVRNIQWSNNKVSISDSLRMDKPCIIKRGFIGGRFSAIHMGSSRYFEPEEILEANPTRIMSDEEISYLNLNHNININRSWSK